MYMQTQRRRRRQAGSGFIDNLKKAHNFLQKTRLLSKVGHSISPHLGKYSTHAARATQGLQTLGYGRRRPRRRVGARRMAGGSFMSFIKKIPGFLKKTKLISTVGSALGAAGVPYASSIGGIASKLGYGRRRRVGRPKKKKTQLRLSPLHIAMLGNGLSLPGGRIRRTRRVRMY